MEELLSFLGQIQPLSAGLEKHLRSVLVQTHFAEGEHLLRIGEVAGNILFLQQGLVRSYCVVNGKEVSNWFMKEGDVCISVLSFFKQQASVDAIMALEDCECLSITFGQLEEIYQRFPEFNVHGRLITASYYCKSEERHHDRLRRTPAEKYKKLVENDFDLLVRVRVKYLASFLNVSERTLVQIRSQYHKHSKR
jgi:CRP-like cAMP-binding protein